MHCTFLTDPLDQRFQTHGAFSHLEISLLLFKLPAGNHKLLLRSYLVAYILSCCIYLPHNATCVTLGLGPIHLFRNINGFTLATIVFWGQTHIFIPASAVQETP